MSRVGKAPVTLRGLSERPALQALAGTVLGNVPGLALPFLITLRIDAGRLTDAYFYAFAIALFGTAIVSLTLENNVVPVAAHHRRAGADRLRAFVRGLILRSVAWSALGYLVVGLAFAGSVLVRDNWSANEKQLCVELIAIFGLYLVALAATSVISGCLYAFGNFFVTSLTIGIRSLLPLPVLLLLAPGATALLCVAATLAVGECLRALVLGRHLRRAMAGLPAVGALDAGAAQPPSVWSTALPYGLAMALVGANQLVDRIVAGSLEPGAVTTLDLAEKAFYTPVKILMASILLVSGARWAGIVLDRPSDLAGDFWRSLRRVARHSVLLAVVSAAGLVVVAHTVEGSVAGVEVREFSIVLAILMIGFPAAIVTNAGVRLLTVLRRTRLFPVVAVVSFAASVAGSIVGAATFGTAGIALSGTVWRTVNAVLFVCFSATALARMRAGHGPPASPSPLGEPGAGLATIRMESR